MYKKLVIIIILIALFFSLCIYKFYISNSKTDNEVFLVQVGAYKNYDNVVKITRDIENYSILKEDDLYKIFIGVTRSQDVYDKLVNIYVPDYSSFKKVIKINDKDIYNKIDKYDELIRSVKSKDEINLIVKEELKMISNIFNEKV